MSEVVDFLNRNFKDGDPHQISQIQNKLIAFLGPFESYRFLPDSQADPEDQGLSYLPGRRVEALNYDPKIDWGNFNSFEFYSYKDLKYVRIAIDLGSAEEHYVIVSEENLARWNQIGEKYQIKAEY